MPRTARAVVGGLCHHVINRGNGRANAPQSEAELEALRRSVVRGVPFGDEEWRRVTAERSNLGFTLRPRGRPKKVAEILDDGAVQLELVK